MEDTRAIADVTASLVRLMVDKPDMVHLEAISSAAGVLYRISVAPDDVGRLIGKQGRTAHALRVILGAISMAAKQKINLDIVE